MSDSSRDHPSDGERATVKASLRRFAGPGDEAVIAQAVAAIDDLQAAVSFVETVGLGELERAVASVDDPSTCERGERALETFRRYRRAATAEGADPDHFHHEYRTDLSRDDEAPIQ